MSGELESLIADITQRPTVADGVATLVRGLSARLDAAMGNHDALTVLQHDLHDYVDGLAQAVVAGTPAPAVAPVAPVAPVQVAPVVAVPPGP